MSIIKVIFVWIVIFLTIGDSSVFIKLGSYSNRENLAKQISNLRYGLQDTAYILEENYMFKAYSSQFASRDEALAKLDLYREVFPDAYIMEAKNLPANSKNSIYKEHKKEHEESDVSTIAKSETLKRDIIYEKEIETPPPPPKRDIELVGVKHSDEVMVPKSKEKEDLSLYSVLQDNKFYICPHNIKTKSQKILIEVHFQDDNVVKYRTVIGKVPAMAIPYIIRGDKLYFTRGNRVNPYQYSKLDNKFFDYYVISQWSKGKNINRMRYYPKEEDAKSYLNSLQF